MLPSSCISLHELSILAFQRGALQNSMRGGGASCTLSIFLLFCSLLLPSGGLTPTEESQLHKIGCNKELIDLLTVQNPYLDIEKHDLNKILGIHAHVLPLHMHTCLQAYVHKLHQRASLYLSFSLICQRIFPLTPGCFRSLKK